MPSNKAVIKNGKIVYGVDADVSKPNETQARSNRQDMKTKHRKDMLQKNQVDYYKAYPNQLDNLDDETKRLLT